MRKKTRAEENNRNEYGNVREFSDGHCHPPQKIGGGFKQNQQGKEKQKN
jgi:hypothetical protein